MFVMYLINIYCYHYHFFSFSKSYDAVLNASPAPNPNPNVVNASLLPPPERNNTTDANAKPVV